MATTTFVEVLLELRHPITDAVLSGGNNPQGFILTTVLGIVGSIVASFLGQAIGLYGPDQGAGFIGAIVGAVIVLAIWHFIERQRQPY